MIKNSLQIINSYKNCNALKFVRTELHISAYGLHSSPIKFQLRIILSRNPGINLMSQRPLTLLGF